VALCEGFDLQAAGVAAAGIAAEFKPTPDQLGTFFSTSTLGLFLGALAGGRLADSYGRKRVLVASVLLFGLCSLLTATAHDIGALSWARFFTGWGLGGVFPNLLALVNESSTPQRRSASVALVYSGMPFGGAVASLVSMLTAPTHWRLIFLVGGAIPVVLAPILIAVLRESSEFERAARASPNHGSFIAVFADGRAIVTILLWLSSFLELLILYLLLSWLPTLLVASGFSKAEAAGVQIAFNVGGALAALSIGRLLEGRARNLSIITACVAVPFFVLLLSRVPPQLSWVVVTVFALGGSVLAVQGFLYATAPRCYPTLIRGVALGTAVAMGRLGSIVGPKLGGTLRAAGHSSSELLMDIVPIVLVGSVTALVFAWLTLRTVQLQPQPMRPSPPA
jgi:AAHS family 3-hydroxyphenylpropionic acid transporter